MPLLLVIAMLKVLLEVWKKHYPIEVLWSGQCLDVELLRGYITPEIKEYLIILVVILLIFGGRKLPELGKGLAQGIRVFKKELSDDDASKKKNEADTDEKSQEGS